jgi:hypothetical protein
LITEEPVEGRRVEWLRWDATILEGVTHAVPLPRRSWTLEPIRSERWSGVGNSFEGGHAVSDLAANLALPGAHHEIAGRDAHEALLAI